MTPRAVFDCMVFLQAAARKQGPAAACLELVRAKRLELCVSPEVLAEVHDVLTRPRTLKKFPDLTPENVAIFLEDVETLAVATASVPPVVSLARDPKDELYLNLAIAAGAQYVVSRDNDLLDLMQDEAFCQQYPNLTILDPVALLRQVAGP